MEKSFWAAVVLAAGESSRMGMPKQLLVWQNETLLRRAARAALSRFAPVCVVLGANADCCKEEIADLPVQIAVNVDWENGMASSLRVGIERVLRAAPDTAGVLVMLCDQPHVGPESLARLWEDHQKSRAGGALVTAAAYNDTYGVPALFEREAFPDLLALTGAEGAKKVIGKWAKAGQAHFVPLPEAAGDVDTPDDYARLRELPLPLPLPEAERRGW